MYFVFPTRLSIKQCRITKEYLLKNQPVSLSKRQGGKWWELTNNTENAITEEIIIIRISQNYQC